MIPKTYRHKSRIYSSKFWVALVLGCSVLLPACSAEQAATELEEVKVASDAATSLPDPLAAGWQGKPVCETLHEDAKQRVLRCTFEPNTGHERHYHDPHFGYTLEGGKARLTDENGVREVDLVKGGSIASPGTAWHEMMNIGDTTLVFLIVEPK